jgi:hypothetical protein
MAVATLGTLAAAATLWFGHLPTGWFFVGPFSFRVADEAPSARHLRRSLVQLVIFWTTFFVVVPMVLVTVEERLNLHWTALDRAGLRLAGAVAFVLASALGLWSCVTMARRGNGTPLPADTARELVPPSALIEGFSTGGLQVGSSAATQANIPNLDITTVTFSSFDGKSVNYQ